MLYAAALKRAAARRLGRQQVGRVARGLTARRHDTGGSSSESRNRSDFFVILNGSVECTRYAPARTTPCARPRDGRPLRRAVPDDGRAALTCIALAECECLKIPKDI